MPTVGRTIAEVRNSEFAKIDDARAVAALRRLTDASEGILDGDITFNDAEASMIVAMLRSREYLAYIASEVARTANTKGEGDFFMSQYAE